MRFGTSRSPAGEPRCELSDDNVSVKRTRSSDQSHIVHSSMFATGHRIARGRNNLRREFKFSLSFSFGAPCLSVYHAFIFDAHLATDPSRFSFVNTKDIRGTINICTKIFISRSCLTEYHVCPRILYICDVWYTREVPNKNDVSRK